MLSYRYIKGDNPKQKGKEEMKFNKVIREYLEAEIYNKKEEARKNNPVYVDYTNQKKEIEEKIRDLKNEFDKQVTDILVAYGMDTTIRKYNGEMPAAKAICSFDEAFIRNEEISNSIKDFDNELYKKSKQIAKQIELDCALGADKVDFMRMIENINFE